MMANITKEEIVVEGMRVVNYNERAWIKQTKAIVMIVDNVIKNGLL